MSIDGVSFHARIEIRYLPAPDCWVISVWDNSTGEMLINMIPLVCSYGEINDLFLPFRHLRGGQGMGSLFVIRNTDEPRTTDPAGGNLMEFRILFGFCWNAGICRKRITFCFPTPGSWRCTGRIPAWRSGLSRTCFGGPYRRAR